MNTVVEIKIQIHLRKKCLWNVMKSFFVKSGSETANIAIGHAQK